MIAFPGLNIGPLLASGAVTSLVLGLALQPILGNFFSGLVISLERPFRIDDWIEYQGIEAKVVGITWRTTRLRTRDNDDLVVSNARIAQEDVKNFYYPHPLHMERIYVGVHYRTPPYRVKQALLRAAARVDKVLDKPWRSRGHRSAPIHAAGSGSRCVAPTSPSRSRSARWRSSPNAAGSIWCSSIRTSSRSRGSRRLAAW